MVEGRYVVVVDWMVLRLDHEGARWCCCRAGVERCALHWRRSRRVDTGSAESTTFEGVSAMGSGGSGAALPCCMFTVC